jgi:hypothetical protein
VQYILESVGKEQNKDPNKKYIHVILSSNRAGAQLVEKINANQFAYDNFQSRDNVWEFVHGIGAPVAVLDKKERSSLETST